MIAAMRTPTPTEPAAIGIWVAVLRTHPGVSAFATLAATIESPAWVTRMPVTAVLSACVRLMIVDSWHPTSLTGRDHAAVFEP